MESQKSQSQINADKNSAQGVVTTGTSAGGRVGSVLGVANVPGGNNRVNPVGGPSQSLASHTSDKSAFSTARALYDKENVEPDSGVGADERGQGTFEPEPYLDEFFTQYSQRLEMEMTNKKDNPDKIDDVAGGRVVSVKEEVVEPCVSEEAAQLLFQDGNTLESIPQEPIKKTQELLSYASVDFDQCVHSTQESSAKKKPKEIGPSPAKRPNIPIRQKERIETIRSVHYPRGINKQEMVYKKFFKKDFGRVRNVTERLYDFGSPSGQPSSTADKSSSLNSGNLKSRTMKPSSSSSVKSKPAPEIVSSDNSGNIGAGPSKTSANPRDTKLGQMNKSPTKQARQAPPSNKSASKTGNSKSSGPPIMSTPISIYESFMSENAECPIPPDLPRPPQNEVSDDDGDEEVEEVLSADYAHLEDPGEDIENELLNQADNDVDHSAGNDGLAVQGQGEDGHEGYDGLDGYQGDVVQDRTNGDEIEEVENVQRGPEMLGGEVQYVEDEERAPDLLGGVLEEDVEAVPVVFPSKQKETLGRSKIFPNLVERTVKS